MPEKSNVTEEKMLAAKINWYPLYDHASSDYMPKLIITEDF
jgi:hypothetical protein